MREGYYQYEECTRRWVVVLKGLNVAVTFAAVDVRHGHSHVTLSYQSTLLTYTFSPHAMTVRVWGVVGFAPNRAAEPTPESPQFSMVFCVCPSRISDGPFPKYGLGSRAIDQPIYIFPGICTPWVLISNALGSLSAFTDPSPATPVSTLLTQAVEACRRGRDSIQ